MEFTNEKMPKPLALYDKNKNLIGGALFDALSEAATHHAQNAAVEMHCFYTSTPDVGRNFIAIYGDGSQVDAYAHTEEGFKDSGGDPRPDAHWFADAGYLFYIYLPKDFKLWFQK